MTHDALSGLSEQRIVIEKGEGLGPSAYAAVKSIGAEPVTEEVKVKKYRALQFYLKGSPESGLDWVRMIWGLDAWYGPVPVFKTLVLANVVVWWLTA